VPRSYLPFGAGRHRCPGVNLATSALTGVLRAVVELGVVERAPEPVLADARTTLLPRGLRIGVRRPALVRAAG